MTKRIAVFLAVLFCTTNLVRAAQSSQEENATHAASDKTPNDRNRADQQDLKTDLERMHALLGQMQRNVAFVSTGDTPLKHQFELEIEMWQLLLRDMEKKVDRQKPQ